jgi:hypothetical protein
VREFAFDTFEGSHKISRFHPTPDGREKEAPP